MSGSFVFEQPFEHADGGMERRAPAQRTFWRRFNRFAVPSAIFQLLAQELICQSAVRFFEIRSEGENSAVDAGLRLAMKERAVVERLEDEPLVDAVDHFSGLFAGGVETKIHQNDESVEGNEPAPIIRAALVASRRLQGQKLGSPALGRNARPLGCYRVGRFIGEVPHDLPADGRIGIEEPFDVSGPG